MPLNEPGDDPLTPEKDGGRNGDAVTFRLENQIVAVSSWYESTNTRLNIHPPLPDSKTTLLGDENSSLALSIPVMDAGNDVDAYAWDWENDGVIDSVSPSPAHTWPDSGSYTVRAVVTDLQGGTGESTFTVNIQNLAPSASFHAPAYVEAGKSFQVSMDNPLDPSPIDQAAGFSYAFDCGNGYAQYSSSSQISCQAPENGQVTVKGKIRDRENGEKEYSTSVAVYNLFTLTLQPGWNLVSFNLQPANPTIDQVLKNISGTYDYVFAWDASRQAWLEYLTGNPAGSTLQDLDEKDGFWIHITASQAVTLEVAGLPVASSEIQLFPGWNLVGMPSGNPIPLADVLPAQGQPHLIMKIYAYDATSGTDAWKLWDQNAPAWASDLDTLSPGLGYWIKTQDATTWRIPVP